ncbi:MAG: DUF255 domain-containing protein [Acidobacteria bacterium]|nr:DUF255 domain-containing protein [Acidobacteriota bacterium]MCG3193778.1 hypothetical protein [Thermoanaerobaculia bacterium]
MRGKAAAGLALLLFSGLARAASPVTRPPNRLVHEKSPYLLQHATNPMDWYPWGPEALEKARRENKPVFLSVGYSTCHWCHVMEAQVFTDEGTAAFMAEHFVSIKVDREERPDIDATYMNATHIMTGRGGWPNSLFLTPDLAPFWAGTYLPRDDFRTVSTAIANAWENDREKVLEVAGRAASRLREIASLPAGEGELRPELLDAAVGALSRRFDAVEGGFSGAPKFPPHSALRILLERQRRAPSPGVAAMIRTTLDRMAAGGIHDHLGGGFHRYATDGRWRIPHFEKMLYDNAQLAVSYLEASQLLNEPRYANVARGIFRWTAREMTGPEGGFFTAQDADSDGHEGLYYTWTPAEIRKVLGADPSTPFEVFHGVTGTGNFEGRTVLHTSVPSDAARERELEHAREKLLSVRQGRVRPATDDKRVTGLNGLMISAYVRGYEVLKDAEYLSAASRAADFLTAKVWDPRARVSRRMYRNGASHIEAFLEDYAAFGQALLDLHRVTGDPARLRLARDVAGTLLARFGEPDGGFRESSAAHGSFVASFADPFDNQEPAAVAAATSFLVALEAQSPGNKYGERARAVMKRYAGAVERAPETASTLLLAYLRDRKVQTGGALRGGPKDDGAKVTKGPVTVAVAWRGEGVAELTLQVREGWHISSSAPHQTYLKPTTVTLDPVSKGWKLGTVSYPKGREARLSQAPQVLSVYEGKTVITARLTARTGAGLAALRVAFQACDDRTCLRPEAVTLTLPSFGEITR